MSATGLDVFDTTIEKTNIILKDIENELDWGGRRNQSYLALRTILHAIRDRLPLNEAVHLGSQLPLLLKGVYYDGWRPEDKPIKMHRDEFLLYIGNEFKFDTRVGLEEITKIVFNKLINHLDPAEANKILTSMPNDLADLLCIKL